MRDKLQATLVTDLHKIIAKDEQLHQFWHILPDSGRQKVEDGFLELIWQLILARGQDARAYGKTFQQFGAFIMTAKAGKRIQFHGADWVAMDRKTFEELQAGGSGNKAKIISESDPEIEGRSFVTEVFVDFNARRIGTNQAIEKIENYYAKKDR